LQPNKFGLETVNISPLSSIDSPRADNDSPHKAQLHERLNAVATLSSPKAQLHENFNTAETLSLLSHTNVTPHSDSIQRLSRDSKIR